MMVGNVTNRVKAVRSSVRRARQRPMRRHIRRTYTALVPHRRLLNVVGDGSAWAAALALSLLFRYDLDLPGRAAHDLLVLVPLVVAVQFLLGIRDGLYVGRWSLGSFEEVAALVRTVAGSGLILVIVDLRSRLVPLSVALAAPLVALGAMGGARYTWRLLRERRRRPSQTAQPLLVYGAGEAAANNVNVRHIPPSLRGEKRRSNPSQPGWCPPAVQDRLLRLRLAMTIGARA